MCLQKINKELTKKLKSSDESIIAYKLISSNNKSLYNDYKWKKGLNISNRSSTEITEEELEKNEIDKGFHFFLDKPKNCPCQYPCQYRCLYQYLHLYQYLYQYQCQLENPINKLTKFKINPEDIITAGEGTLQTIDIVAIKATLISGI